MRKIDNSMLSILNHLILSFKMFSICSHLKDNASPHILQALLNLLDIT